MKLPKVLARFRSSGTAKEPLPEPDVVATPVEAAPARSRTERLNQWLALGANMGVLLGLIPAWQAAAQDDCEKNPLYR